MEKNLVKTVINIFFFFFSVAVEMALNAYNFKTGVCCIRVRPGRRESRIKSFSFHRRTRLHLLLSLDCSCWTSKYPGVHRSVVLSDLPSGAILGVSSAGPLQGSTAVSELEDTHCRGVYGVFPVSQDLFSLCLGKVFHLVEVYQAKTFLANCV